jgi:hypothetical protein
VHSPHFITSDLEKEDQFLSTIGAWTYDESSKSRGRGQRGEGRGQGIRGAGCGSGGGGRKIRDAGRGAWGVGRKIRVAKRELRGLAFPNGVWERGNRAKRELRRRAFASGKTGTRGLNAVEKRDQSWCPGPRLRYRARRTASFRPRRRGASDPLPTISPLVYSPLSPFNSLTRPRPPPLTPHPGFPFPVLPLFPLPPALFPPQTFLGWRRLFWGPLPFFYAPKKPKKSPSTGCSGGRECSDGLAIQNLGGRLAKPGGSLYVRT